MTALKLVPDAVELMPAPERFDQILIAAAGRYKALRKIADGGTAEIFLGEHVGTTGFRRLVAIKRMRSSVSAKPELSRLLVEEAHVCMNLSHGNLVEVRDVGESHGRQFLVLELVDGWTLEQLLARGRATGIPIPPRVALHVAAEVCRGLGYAHDRGIVHCDICPHNILVAETGEVKLADFGIARMPARPVLQGLIAGKPAYMSPEQASGEALDARSDLFSLGTVLYYLLTDALPFKAGDDAELMARVARGEFVSPLKRRPSLPKEMGQLLIAAMRSQPWARYQTAHELLGAIEVVLRSNARSELDRWLGALHEKDRLVPVTREASSPGVPLKAVRTPVTKQVPQRSHRWLWAALIAAVASLGLGRAWTFTSTATAAVPVQQLAARVGQPQVEVAVSPPDPGPEVAVIEADEPVVTMLEPTVLGVRASVVKVADEDRAIVMLDTEPEGADVSVDSRVLGTTPVALRFRTGIPFEVTFLREGESPLVKWLTVERPVKGPPRVLLTEPR